MRNKMKRVLSGMLSVLMVASVAATNVSANSGEKALVTFKEAQEAQFGYEVETCKYYFYMPEDWKNEYNDYYDASKGLDSCAAGVYWWNGFGCPGDYAGYSKDWPGYAVTEKDSTCNNVFVAEIPSYNDSTDAVPIIVWNNTVDGGENRDLPIYEKAVQTGDIQVSGYAPGTDNYGFYPDGLESMEDMIFVCNPADTEESPASGKLGYKGEWFYYYGNGEYGTAPTKAEAGDNVYSNGEFPPTGLVLDVTADSVGAIGVGGTKTVTANKDTAEATSENADIATVTKGEGGKFVITGVAPGETKIVFTNFNDKTLLEEKVELPIIVIDPSFDVTSLSMKVRDEEYVIGMGVGENAVITYSNPGVAKYNPSTFTVKALKVGTTTVTLTQGDKKISFKVTVKAPKLNATSKKLDAGKSYTLKVSNNAGKATFISSKPSVATVDKKTGKVVALKKGTATITAKVDGKNLTCKITVTSNPKLKSSTVKVGKGKKATVAVIGGVKVKASKCKFANITASATKLTVKGTKKGTQKITVTINGVNTKLKVVVK